MRDERPERGLFEVDDDDAALLEGALSMKRLQRALCLFCLVGTMVGAGIGLVFGAIVAAGTGNTVTAGLSLALLLGLLGLAIAIIAFGRWVRTKGRRTQPGFRDDDEVGYLGGALDPIVDSFFSTDRHDPVV